jgi:hypothetical protein
MYERVSMLSKPAGGKHQHHNHGRCPRKLPPTVHMKSNFRCICVGLIGDNAPSKQIWFSLAMRWVKPLKCSGGVAMMEMNLTSPSERFEGFRPADVSCLERYCTNVLLARLTKYRR